MSVGAANDAKCLDNSGELSCTWVFFLVLAGMRELWRHGHESIINFCNRKTAGFALF